METPLGKISILLDGEEYKFFLVIPHKLSKGRCKELKGCYRIAVNVEPDGKQHELKCIIENASYETRIIESGEDFSCISFYDNQGNKLSLGAEGETGINPDGTRFSSKYDYRVDYLENGISYILDYDSFDNRYIFGLAWIDKVTDCPERDIQTWLGADVTLD